MKNPTHSMIGIVQAEPAYGLRCWLRRHTKTHILFHGLKVPFCRTCNAKD